MGRSKLGRVLAVACALAFVASVPEAAGAITGGRFATFALTSGEVPVQMVPDGARLLFITAAGRVGRISSAGAVSMTEVTAPPPTVVHPASVPPVLVAETAQGIWVYQNDVIQDGNESCQVYLFEPDGHTMIRLLHHPIDSVCVGGIVDHSGNLWVTAAADHSLARLVEVSPAGVVTQIDPHPYVGLGGPVVLGPDGAIDWAEASRPNGDAWLIHQVSGGVATARLFWIGHGRGYDLIGLCPGHDNANPTPDPTSSFFHLQLLNGPNGDFWYTNGGYGVGLLTATSQGVCHVPYQDTSAVSSTDGALWYVGSDRASPQVRWFRLDPTNGTLYRSADLPTGSPAFSVSETADGDLWAVVSTGTGSQLVRYSPPPFSGT